MRLVFPALFLAVAGLLAACGQRGPLTLPSRDGEETVATEPEPSAEEEAEARDDDKDP